MKEKPMRSTGLISAFTILLRWIVATKNKLPIIAVLFLGGLITGNVLAADDPIKEGGIGGTGAPAMHGGIGGTGLQPNDETAKQTLAGKVMFIVGKVEAQNLGQIRTLAKGDPVRVGDTLKSSKEASLQLRMEDGGTIVLRPESQLVIESFAYNGIQDGSEHIALDLVAGGFRAVTGNIGKLHKENYSIRTPNATVGIRGTDHETVFVGRTPPGQTAVVEPGTYNHVISGATLLQSGQGKLLIKPNQTGFAPLNGASPILIDKTLPIFGDQRSISERQGEHHDEMGNSGKETNNSLSDTTSETEQDKVTQPVLLANSPVDLNTLETDSSPAEENSGVVGAHMSGWLQTAGGAQAGNPGEQLYEEDGFPTSYSNDATGYNYLAVDAPPIQSGTAMVDSASVTWGIYAGGVAFDISGNALPINYHAFAFTDGGVTPPSVISAIGGTAVFSNPVGSSSVTESGNIRSNGGVTLNVGVNLGTGILTSYNLAVTDASNRNWTGTISGPVPLSTFANGTPLAGNCNCGSGMVSASGSAAGMLIGTNAGGLISSYVLGTTTGQAVAGAVVITP
jgi:hypothetical protein